MKVGISVTMHWSDDLRPNGDEFIHKIVNSINDTITFDKTIYVIDNGSQHQSRIKELPNVNYKKIQDQSIDGITGAWNLGILRAIKDKCDIIINTNDDLEFNDHVNDFINYIYEDPDNLDTIYGPQPIHGQPINGTDNHPNKGTLNVNGLNGFFFAFTREHYFKYAFKPDLYFNKNNKYNFGDGKWGGQEGQFIENMERGCKCKVLNFCWINHNKQRGWKKTKKIYANI